MWGVGCQGVGEGVGGCGDVIAGVMGAGGGLGWGGFDGGELRVCRGLRQETEVRIDTSPPFKCDMSYICFQLSNYYSKST